MAGDVSNLCFGAVVEGSAGNKSTPKIFERDAGDTRLLTGLAP